MQRYARVHSCLPTYLWKIPTLGRSVLLLWDLFLRFQVGRGLALGGIETDVRQTADMGAGVCVRRGRKDSACTWVRYRESNDSIVGRRITESPGRWSLETTDLNLDVD